MVILGLGSNVGDRLKILRDCLAHLKQIPELRILQVSPLYFSDALMPENAPASWDMPYINLALRCETRLEPHALLPLLKAIEIKLGRKPETTCQPRPVDIDILAWDDLIIADEKLQIPHQHLTARPFALWPLADVAPRWVYPANNEFHGKTATQIALQWGSRFNGAAPLHTRQIAQRIDTPQLMGILNITPDSFTDPRLNAALDETVRHARELSDLGADILDIGAEATNPQAKAISATTEWQRLEKILEAILAHKSSFTLPPKISIDTRHAETAKKALALGVDWINDISGLRDPAMREVIAAHPCDVVIMHELGIPSDKTRLLPETLNPSTAVYTWMEKTLNELAACGIQRERIILDIGIGFGKNAEQSLELLQSIADFKNLRQRLLVGHSRKSFLKQFGERAAIERDVETLPISLYLANQSIDYLRLHNVDMCARAFKVSKTLA